MAVQASPAVKRALPGRFVRALFPASRPCADSEKTDREIAMEIQVATRLCHRFFPSLQLPNRLHPQLLSRRIAAERSK